VSTPAASDTKRFPDGVRILKGPAIEGVKVIPLRRIPDERGTIFHIMSSKDPWFERFGEIYCSTVFPDVVKGWHKHRDMTLNYACLQGRVKCVVYDDRESSPTKGSLMEIYLGPDSYNLLVVPPDTWNGFKGMSDPFAMIANCCTHAHDPTRSDRLDPFSPTIPYDWARKDH
jgi:dTDP-4-dehydrorhamnose 3,5-epimerase